MTTAQDSIDYVKFHKKELVAKICDPNKYKPSRKPFTLFMAGSPGSGKTEYSRSFLKELQKKDPQLTIIRLDTDELRELIPQYTKSNSDEVQLAATLLFDKTFDYIQNNSLNAIIDTTFASPKSVQNVARAIKRGRKVGILYLYQDPVIAWNYTQKRERMEGRTVPKSVFINAYFAAKKNVSTIKEMYGNQVELHLFEKDKENSFVKKAKFNVLSLDKHLKESYTVSMLEKLLPNQV